MAAYQWKNGSRIRVSAQAAGEMCEELAGQGRLTAQELLDRNRAEDAPLHKAFEWDDGKAAEEYRLSQARHIIACLVVKPEKKTDVPVRCFFNIDRRESHYRSIGAILEDTDSTELLLQTALGELAAFQRKYAILEKLTPVFGAIEQVRMNLDADGPAEDVPLEEFLKEKGAIPA